MHPFWLNSVNENICQNTELHPSCLQSLTVPNPNPSALALLSSLLPFVVFQKSLIWENVIGLLQTPDGYQLYIRVNDTLPYSGGHLWAPLLWTILCSFSNLPFLRQFVEKVNLYLTRTLGEILCGSFLVGMRLGSSKEITLIACTYDIWWDWGIGSGHLSNF